MQEVVVSTTGPMGSDAHVHLMDGTELKGVHSATIRMEPGQLNVVELEIVGPVISVNARVSEVNFICPLCSHSETHKCDGETLGGT